MLEDVPQKHTEHKTEKETQRHLPIKNLIKVKVKICWAKLHEKRGVKTKSTTTRPWQASQEHQVKSKMK